ncbi:RecX family transcriptional regulator, partial [Patescibacteria group bacterium]|nr:RecX family transcriptional regulator [Patescibacteria group bacterium]
AKRKYQRLLEKHPSTKDSYAIQSKLYAYLAQKGYTQDEVKSIISKIK